MVFVIFSWGSVAYNKQALLAAQSILARSSSEKILVFASHPEFFVDTRIQTVPITKLDLKSWIGPLGYIHKAKIHIIKKALLQVEDSEPLCYIDSDMYCYDIPAALMEHKNSVLMFNYEGRVSASFHPKLHRFLTANKELLEKNNYPDLYPDFKMYNSGLIYLPASQWRKKALDLVLDLNDLLYVHFPQNWIEQVAFSHVLPKFSNIHCAPKGFEHYWGYNCEVAHLLKDIALEDIKKIAESESMFNEMCCEAKRIQKTPSNRMRLFLGKQKTSLRKRFYSVKIAFLKNKH